ncbi:hypothetical protein FSP39_003553 [Pinctada imbricata]|uniref:MYND-type domain-containing protein n=1 Tax=Pinctada imbricata TaxID=66713 RepID=A0AA88XJB8_PINIB|nr:hypothetical protein FSP39_003553 [Pinctada imbricata]
MKVEHGAVIQKFKPFVTVLSNENHGSYCESCFLKRTSLKSCTACKTIKYCGVQCQRREWNIHKLECKCLKNTAPNVPLPSVRMMLRLIIKEKLDCEDDQGDYGIWRRGFADLMSHSDDIKTDSKRCEQLTQIMFTLSSLTKGVMELPSAQHILEIFGKMLTNSFTICNGEIQSLGVGLYLGASWIDHSCDPNAVIVFEGNTLVLRAVKAIQILSTRDISVSYIDLLPTTKDRKDALREQYYFECTCSHCSNCDIMDQKKLCIKCQDNSCTGFCVKTGNTFQCCNKCGLSISENNSLLEEFEKETENKLTEIKEAKDSKDADLVLRLAKQYRNKYNRILHPLSLRHTKLADAMFDACIDLGNWTDALVYGLQTIEPYRQYYPSFSPILGVQYMKIGKLQLYLQRFQDALNSLKKAESIISVTHGKDHSLYVELAEMLHQTCQEMQM